MNPTLKLLILETIREVIDNKNFEEDINRIRSEIEEEWWGGQKHQSWKLIPARDLIILWNTYAKYGRIDEKKLLRLWDIVKDSVLKILVNSDITSGNDPSFFGKEEYNEITREDWKHWAVFISDRSGSEWGRGSIDWEGPGMGRYSDVGRHLFKLLEKGYKASTDEELLIAIDQILNFVHGSGPMAKWFVEGGTSTLNKLRDMDVKGIVIPGKLTEADDIGKDYVGTTFGGAVKAVPVKNAWYVIHNDFNMISGVNSQNWRYISSRNLVLWNQQPTEEDKIKVGDFLYRRGIKNLKHSNIYDYGNSLRKESINSSFEADYGRGPLYVEVFKNPTSKELRECKPHFEIGAILTDKDIFVWNREKAYHRHVMTHLKLPDALPILIIPDLTNMNRMDIIVTDASRGTKWDENPNTEDFIVNHPFFRNKQVDHVSYWNEDIVGDWSKKQVTENQNKQFLGNCKDDSLIKDIFGSVSEFARQVEINGDTFEYKGIVVTYDKNRDIHYFWKKNNVNEVDITRVPSKFINKGSYSVMEFPKPEDFKIGDYYDSGDVLNYIMGQHREFEDEDRVDGIFQYVEVNPRSIPESDWYIDDKKVELLSKSKKEFPPIVVDVYNGIIDGGHRLAAAVLRWDKKIKVFKQITL